MAVTKRGSVWYYDFQHEGVRYQGRVPHAKNKTQARDHADAIKRGLRMGGSPVTVKEAANDWFQNHAQYLASADTIAFQLKVCNRVLDMETQVSKVDDAWIKEGMDRRRGELTHNKRPPSPSTVNREIIDTLRPILTRAKKKLRANVQDIDWKGLRLKEPKVRVYEFTADQQAAVMRDVLAHHRLIVAFLARYGVRLSEAWFPLDAYDTQSGRVQLRDRKGGTPHTVQLIKADRAMMNERVKRASAAGINHVWYREHKDGSISAVPPSTFQTAMKRAYKRLGIQGARAAHDWRHFAATAFLQSSGDLAATQHLLGHSQITMTRRYAKTHEKAVTDALEKMASPYKIDYNAGHGEAPEGDSDAN